MFFSHVKQTGPSKSVFRLSLHSQTALSQSLLVRGRLRSSLTKMKYFILFAAILVVGDTIVCLPELCASLKSNKPLVCKGSVIKNGGYCGCTDACAKVEGEGCQESFFRGVIPLGKCDTGLECVKQKHVAFGRGVCAKKERKRAALTRCELMKRQNMMIMVVWSGQWVGPNCDANGNFLPEQCDRSGHCFCVTQNGDVIKNTKVLGHAKC
ncbi:uncharacterized protein LOC121381512 isoform X1 [Gigantopelta aegis]|uniref:uncharacterized protein LOC121381512 isoform X1 n=1 Tax=Gigantopelta aegis TaxID=1735272 RepID=UPI001B88AB39|nr:uncharacterized protein LOC121381512 isoform X1 [Gigantopelta aegis]